MIPGYWVNLQLIQEHGVVFYPDKIQEQLFDLKNIVLLFQTNNYYSINRFDYIDIMYNSYKVWLRVE